MKKTLSVMLCLVIFMSAFSVTSFAKSPTASIVSDSFTFTPEGKYTTVQVIDALEKFNDGTYSKSELATKFEGQFRSTDIYANAVDGLDDIYGIEAELSVNSDDVVFAFATTNLQNGEKIGVSKWECMMKNQTEKNYSSVKLLLYGTGALNSKANKTANSAGKDKYRVATVYYLTGKEQKSDFVFTYNLTDVAAKDKNGKVISIVDDFVQNNTANAEYTSEINEICLNMLGAQIRTVGTQGIRFGTKLLTNGYFDKCTEVSYGTLIAVTNQLGNKELTLDSKVKHLDCSGEVYSKTDNYTVFTGEVVDFPENGKYDNVNFTARAYVKYKAPDELEFSVVYADPIIRNVEQLKSIIGIK